MLSKISFLSNIFPIDLETALTLQEQIFKYLWKNKQEQIARKTIFLPKHLGGLNLLEPQAHNMAMRIKHILQLKQKKQYPDMEKNCSILGSFRSTQNFQKVPIFDE